MINNQVRENQLNKMQYVQYECLKTELKEEYEVNMEMVKSIERFIEEMSKNKDERDRA